MSASDRRRSLVFPREHGAWGMLLVPLATGAVVALFEGGESARLVPLVLTALLSFWLRTPIESWLGASPLRARSGSERDLVRGISLALAAAAILALFWLFRGGPNRPLGGIGASAAVAFLVQAFWKKRWPRARTGAQMIGAAGLTSSAPAAYAVATGHWDTMAAALWTANWLFAVNQIQYVQLRIRGFRAANRKEKLVTGRAFLAAQILLLAVLAAACRLHFFPGPAAFAFVPALARGFLWFTRPPSPFAIRALGFTELAHAVVFGILLVWGLT